MEHQLCFTEQAENAIGRLIDTLRPSRESVARRYGVQEYVRTIIARTFAEEQVGPVCLARACQPPCQQLQGSVAPQLKSNFNISWRGGLVGRAEAQHHYSTASASAHHSLLLLLCGFPCGWLACGQVNAYMFGSVPLRTYLPDGDIDLSVFCSQETAQSIRDSWAVKLQSVIEHEQSSGNAPYKIGDVTVINAEVCKRVQCCLMHPASPAAVAAPAAHQQGADVCPA